MTSGLEQASSPAIAALIADLRQALSPAQVVSHPDELIVYECDGFTIPRARPLAVVFPTSTEQVVSAVSACRRHNIAILPRGSGTGLAGGIVAVTPSVQISTARMNRILQIDLRNRFALVEAGVCNLALSAAVASSPYHFAPDPSSQRASTIGGNVATNAGGLHTLKYGVTVNHILGVEIVLADGTVHTVGGPQGHDLGPDITGLICGTEGTLGIITKVWCRLIPRPTAFRTALAIFNDTQKACQSVADIIATGIVPAALEMMDGTMVGIIEEAFHLGFPKTAQAVLVLEVDGQELGLDEDLAQIETICKRNGADFQGGSDPQRRADLWSARKRAFGAIGRASPSYCTQDACVPRSKLPEVLAKCAEICTRHHLRITSVFHAGDGNVHPILMYDESDESQVRAALAASGEILRYCISIGGTLTGEHGVGIEKLAYMRDMFDPVSLAAMHKIRHALVGECDAMNPCKSLPRDGIEIDLLHPQRHVPQ
ncbi:MAG TPA: FAD-linked oxidase C-terminal domain-containing protein [Phycisphaerae bacterium]|nr:FAD-linked oxidase C-terminal domain-containing protein [Phycisphaerae bacterium]